MDDFTEDAGRRLAARFEADRAHLTAVAHRLLGSAAEADDALQEAWRPGCGRPAARARCRRRTPAPGRRGVPGRHPRR
ncbi:hypothetical protein BFF78_10590 [Streptomyces fodineus]|uniref:Uncharacterized protein n=1 Tax=Streptomyces fodineus TaxID=1904616 RepID=A0A1D7Y727_9ACTN|nr:hypothetical protein BFF78_10590 [Streptomyces fodineus]